MKKLVIFLFLGTAASVFGQPKHAYDLDTLLDRYTRSINAADSLLARKFWSQDAEVSFIHPLGNEYGWNGIRNIYAMFANNFSKRKLQYSDERWTNYNEFAWVTFNWVFDATFSSNNKDIQTKGRETQFWKKVTDKWRLVHVHYSAMPLTAREAGF